MRSDLAGREAFAHLMRGAAMTATKPISFGSGRTATELSRETDAERRAAMTTEATTDYAALKEQQAIEREEVERALYDLTEPSTRAEATARPDGSQRYLMSEIEHLLQQQAALVDALQNIEVKSRNRIRDLNGAEDNQLEIGDMARAALKLAAERDESCDSSQ
jgi:uncharacterized protein YjcR